MKTFKNILFTVLFGVPMVIIQADTDMKKERKKMIQVIEAYGEFNDPQVLNVMAAIPREDFVPHQMKANAYANSPLPIGHGQTISQPFIVAYMTHLLKLEPQHKVLEIGTGSGYQAAVLSKLAKAVFTIEIIPELGRTARKSLASYQNVKVRIGDGYQGWPEQAPFDAILLTAAPPKIPQPLLDQLVEGGRLVAPVGNQVQAQQIIILSKINGKIHREQKIQVRFVPMTGEAQQPLE